MLQREIHYGKQPLALLDYLLETKVILGSELQQDLFNCGIDLQTAKRLNMKDTRDRYWVKLLVKTRRLVETVIGQLTERFHLQKVRARDLWHLTNRVYRKLLAQTLAVWINRYSPHPLQFEQLISE